MRTIENIVAEIAPTNIPVLLFGESGTGKEVLARRIHSLSRHCDTPLAKISCASMTPDKLPAQLAEHLRAMNGGGSGGAGTVLFDELSDLDAACQAHLLHALPDGESVPAAGAIASRVISSTTRDLEHETRAGRFRSDLYYRINGVCLRLPPLRERSEDIPALVEFLLAKHASQMSRPHPTLRQESLKTLMNYSWPGNIRELENVLRKIVALGDERLAVSELQAAPAGIAREQAAAPRSYSLKAAARAASREAERELILEALARTRWNRKRAAQELQISYKSLLYKLKQIGIAESEAN
ncbi:MAG: sigma 54-interacting transcriptional regulator [Candidatus Acidiferrales bacterium]